MIANIILLIIIIPSLAFLTLAAIAVPIRESRISVDSSIEAHNAVIRKRKQERLDAIERDNRGRYLSAVSGYRLTDRGAEHEFIVPDLDEEA